MADGPQRREKQIQALKEKQKLDHLQSIVNDTTGRMYSQIEVLFKMLNVDVGHTYSGYLLRKPATKEEVMNNLEVFQLNMATYKLQAKANNQSFLIKQDPTAKINFSEALKMIPQGMERQVLRHVMGTLFVGEDPQPFPESLANRYSNPVEAQKMRENFVRNNQHDILKMQHTLEQISAQTRDQHNSGKVSDELTTAPQYRYKEFENMPPVVHTVQPTYLQGHPYVHTSYGQPLYNYQ